MSELIVKIDELYKKWSGESHLIKSGLESYDSSEVQDFGEYCIGEYKRHIESIPKHETVEQWEDRTGEVYPDDGAVWVLYTFTETAIRVKPYWTLKEYDGYSRSEIVANHHGKPEVTK
jgi:hypothetical protein